VGRVIGKSDIAKARQVGGRGAVFHAPILLA
jgi:hypothetical protein